MTPEDPADPGHAALTRMYLRLSVVNLLLIGCTALFVLWLWRDLGAAHRLRAAAEARTCAPRVVRADLPVRIDETDSRPPENVVTRLYLGAAGTQLPNPVLMTRVDAIRGGSVARVRLGDPAVLRPRGVHVLNLWAPWCRGCMAELPDLQQLLARRTDWQGTVAFVPIKVLDAENPRVSYDKYAARLPASRVQLADRSSDDDLVTALRADPDRKFYRGDLPVTLVLDCNRRVRWAEFQQLGPDTLRDLELTLDRLVAEARDTSAMSLCAGSWCGDGVCTDKDRQSDPEGCPVDCHEQPLRAAAVRPEPAPEPTPPPRSDDPPPCPKDCARCEAGKCLARLQRAKNDPPPAAPPEFKNPCGDGVCDPAAGENSYACCLDCRCEAPLTCQPATAGKHHCRIPHLQ